MSTAVIPVRLDVADLHDCFTACLDFGKPLKDLSHKAVIEAVGREAFGKALAKALHDDVAALAWIPGTPREMMPHAVYEALAVQSETASRIRDEINNPDRPLKYVTSRIIAGLIGIRTLIKTRAKGRFAHASDYERRIIDELDGLGLTTEHNDWYTVVAVPPPLERYSPHVCRAVVDAAYRGVKFRYYYPGGAVVARIQEGLLRPAQIDGDGDTGTKNRHALTLFDNIFGWLRTVDIASVMIPLREQALARDLTAARRTSPGDGANGSYGEALQKNVEFRPFSWFPCSFNEKIIWFGSKQPGSIRKEVLDLSSGEDIALAPPSYQNWMTVLYPISEPALQALLRLSRERDQEGNPVTKAWSDLPSNAAALVG